MMQQKGTAWIGTSNIVVPGNKNTFPPAFQAKSRLHYYSSLFNSVEVNSTFYKTPLPSTTRKWADDVGENFSFTIKLSKAITHSKELEGDFGLLEPFMTAAAGLGEKKGSLLIQFPGKITLDYFDQVESILYEVEENDPDGAWRKAVEFRHDRWYTGETIELLNHFNATMVLQDIPKSSNMNAVETISRLKAGFVYLRFHGPNGDYRDSYTNLFLEEKAALIARWLAAGKDVFAYFNNTIGNAFDNARQLRTMVDGGPAENL
ncbi:DUF72 domain-containing protein [Flavihumibacter petaseus]|nr:DUF72 domain-containing protein [Flavihumibacter petaseus]